MADYKKQNYNIAIKNQGFLLRGIPKRPARKVDQAPIYGARFASGDKDYLDFTFWWFWAQTDWSCGITDRVSWLNNAKYYYSTNIDAFSEYGAIKLMSGLATENTFAENISCGSYETVVGNSYGYIGTKDGADGKPRVYRSDAWATNIVSVWMPTTAEWVNDIIQHKGKIYILTTGSSSATTYVVTKCDADGSNQVDYTGISTTYIYGAMGWQPTGATSVTSDDSTLYVAVTKFTGAKFGIAKTTDNGDNWTKLFDFSYEGNIPCMLLVGNLLYYLIEDSGNVNRLEFRVCDTSTSPVSDTFIYSFPASYGSYAAGMPGASRRLLYYFNGKVIITIPRKEIWQYDGASLTRLIKMDDKKISIGNEAIFDLGYLTQELKGGIIYDNKLWWANLMYDGTYFFNTKKSLDDPIDYWLRPVYTDGSIIFWIMKDANDETKVLYKDSGYKGTADKNFLVFNQIDPISTIKKLFYSITILFNKLVSGQKIILEYSFDEMSTWTELGNVDYAVDGGTITSKIFFFPENTIDTKIWLRAKLEGGGSNTPALKDISMQYLPFPEYKQRWILTIDCFDNLVLLDGKTKEPKRGEEFKNILKTSWWKKEMVSFQDVDYAETLLNGALTASATTVTVDSTNSFPEQGRLKIEQEEILYTGKTATTFTDCIRGARGTVATSHADNILCSNGYNVIITDTSETNPVAPTSLITETIVAVSLLEI